MFNLNRPERRIADLLSGSHIHYYIYQWEGNSKESLRQSSFYRTSVKSHDRFFDDAFIVQTGRNAGFPLALHYFPLYIGWW